MLWMICAALVAWLAVLCVRRDAGPAGGGALGAFGASLGGLLLDLGLVRGLSGQAPTGERDRRGATLMIGGLLLGALVLGLVPLVVR